VAASVSSKASGASFASLIGSLDEKSETAEIDITAEVVVEGKVKRTVEGTVEGNIPPSNPSNNTMAAMLRAKLKATKGSLIPEKNATSSSLPGSNNR
jgi:hypothetical protein